MRPPVKTKYVIALLSDPRFYRRDVFLRVVCSLFGVFKAFKMAPEFTGAKEPDELPEVDTASDAYPVLEERKKERKKERKMSVHVHLRSLLFSRNECRRKSARARTTRA